MPNWCFTSMRFHGNKTEIEDFHKKLEEFTSTNYMENGFGTMWLGNILCGAGLADRIDNSNEDLRIICRGQIIYIDDIDYEFEEDVCFNVQYESAWAWIGKMWFELIKTFGYESVGFSFISEEPGNELYQKYDPYGDFENEKWYVDCYFEGDDFYNEKLSKFEDNRYYHSDEALIKSLQNLLETEETDLEILLEKSGEYKFKHEDSYVHIYEYMQLSEDEAKEV